MTSLTAVVPPGPRLLATQIRRLPPAGGRWLKKAHLAPLPFSSFPDLVDLNIVTGIYLITDAASRVRWLGQASRRDDLPGRLTAHAANPAKAKVFATLRVLHLHDHTPSTVLDAIEGRCADLLALRGTMGPRRWPPATGWLALVA